MAKRGRKSGSTAMNSNSNQQNGNGDGNGGNGEGKGKGKDSAMTLVMPQVSDVMRWAKQSSRSRSCVDKIRWPWNQIKRTIKQNSVLVSLELGMAFESSKKIPPSLPKPDILNLTSSLISISETMVQTKSSCQCFLRPRSNIVSEPYREPTSFHPLADSLTLFIPFPQSVLSSRTRLVWNLSRLLFSKK